MSTAPQLCREKGVRGHLSLHPMASSPSPPALLRAERWCDRTVDPVIVAVKADRVAAVATT
jgi:hypothetical protein